MLRTLTLYGTNGDLSNLRGRVGLLCELAPDSSSLKGVEHCYWPDELLGSPDHALRIASSVVSKLLAQVAEIRRLPRVATLEESFLEQVSYSVQALHLDSWLRAQEVSVCRFDSYSAWLDRLRQIRTWTMSEYDLKASVPFGQANWVRRGIVDLSKSVTRPSELFRRLAPCLRSSLPSTGWSSKR